MKHILLIEDGRPHWPRLRELLAKVNAVVDGPQFGQVSPPVGAGRPDLVIVGEADWAAWAPGSWTGALLVIEKGRPPELVTAIGDLPQQVAASSGIGERDLLALTSRLLGVSERRQFCAVIGVQRAGHPHQHMGASREFSLTGLSFCLGVELRPHEPVVVSFHVPGARRRLSLQAEVVRSFTDPADASCCFGARFIGLSAEERDVLKRFVWAETS